MFRHKKIGISTMLAASIFATTLSPVSALAEEKMRSVREIQRKMESPKTVRKTATQK